jgi:hypothetical protein
VQAFLQPYTINGNKVRATNNIFKTYHTKDIHIQRGDLQRKEN